MNATAKIDPPSQRFGAAGNELKARLVEFARELGFDSCRVAACAPPAHADKFDDWLREGAHGEMEYMARGKEKRRDPQKILPGAKSVVVLALNYFQGERAIPKAFGAATGKIARYAWGDDYHDVIAAKLDKIDILLREFGGQQKCYVDTGPILERDHAAQAGIGWHGKSTMLIDEKLGTWFFLAEILTTLELPVDKPAPDRCGTCERCITACPTGAITAPHRLDARRCISYLTIELKSSIPLELRPLIGDRIFGCDDCLDACPWNRFAQISH
ncbi:MAG TPA: tRNA epoxyqueuosine(34) reductase QueG, partial [Chthoniobacterales bacterium]|nr:tRNA epoxyqueuosine(34) reductase QueG [Chthoniobacterales bacterium]